MLVSDRHAFFFDGFSSTFFPEDPMSMSASTGVPPVLDDLHAHERLFLIL